jgi:hypothetical protein
MIETVIFQNRSLDDPVPNDECSICLGPLNKSGDYGCCGTYAKQLITCGHWFHVACHLNDLFSENWKLCPVCRQKVISQSDMNSLVRWWKRRQSL